MKHFFRTMFDLALIKYWWYRALSARFFGGVYYYVEGDDTTRDSFARHPLRRREDRQRGVQLYPRAQVWDTLSAQSWVIFLGQECLATQTVRQAIAGFDFESSIYELSDMARKDTSNSALAFYGVFRGEWMNDPGANFLFVGLDDVDKLRRQLEDEYGESTLETPVTIFGGKSQHAFVVDFLKMFGLTPSIWHFIVDDYHTGGAELCIKNNRPRDLVVGASQLDHIARGVVTKDDLREVRRYYEAINNPGAPRVSHFEVKPGCHGHLRDLLILMPQPKNAVLSVRLDNGMYEVTVFYTKEMYMRVQGQSLGGYLDQTCRMCRMVRHSPQTIVEEMKCALEK